ncbi:phosphatidylinositol phosphate synthase [Sciscionella marina]|uniref:phosphatidylinositol phosphate synthase n=1 Tax=Sciscionella marina TaxID=508770 RepID=UPI0003763760|nr:CDP-alcohol phosphatidyltransferase family protein [Sciscionella marina]
MLNVLARAPIAKLTDPVAHWLVDRGATPNVITVVGSVCSCAAALWFFPHGQLVLGALVVAVFLLFDLLDGAMARVAGATAFGAVLDASCDRLVDAVLFGSLTWWAFVIEGDHWLGLAALVGGCCAQVISYIKARAEANGLEADGGLAERAERFILALVGVGLHGLGVPYAAQAGLGLLALLTVFTIGQRLASLYRSASS